MSDLLGKTILHYRILEHLGQGGMGVVYKAEDTKLKREVAIKFLPHHIAASEDERKRFTMEAQAAAGLNHPNIATIHAIEEFDNEIFIVMEYIEGQELKKTVNSQQLSVNKVIDIATQIGKGLKAAHEKNIIHRDIKTSNIMITPKGDVKIMDFGLAKVRGAAQMTKIGTTLGTAAYMSPEQARGEEVDHRTDIWSLGAVLYEMLSGHVPFRGDYEQAVTYSIMNEDPEPVSSLRSSVPIELERIISRSLAKEQNERYQSIDEMLSDLKANLKSQESGIGGTAGHMAAENKLQPSKPSAKNRLLLLTIPILVLLAGFVLYQFLKKDKSTDPISNMKLIAVLPFENLGPAEDEYFADGMTEEITSRLTSVAGLGVISRTSTLQYKNTTKSIKQIAAELGVSHILEGTVRWAKSNDDSSRLKISPRLIQASDDLQIWAHSYDRVIDDVFAIQNEIASEVIDNMGLVFLAEERQGVETIPTGNLEAYHAYLRGLDYNTRDPYSEEIRRLEIAMFQRAVALDPSFALAYAALSMAHANLVNLGMDATPERLAMAKSAADRALALQPDLAEAHLAMAYYYYWGFQDHENALLALEEVRRIKPNHIELFKALAAIYRRQEGKTSEALDYMKRVVELSPRDATWVRELGNTYLHQGKFDQAISTYDRCIALAPDLTAAYVVKVITHWSQPDGIKKARDVLEAMPERNDPLSNYVWTMQEIRERRYQAALDRTSKIPVEVVELPDALVTISAARGNLYLLMGESKQAQAHLEAALATLQKELRDRPNDHRGYTALGIVYAGLGMKDKAIEYGRRGVDLYPVSKDAFHGPTRLVDMTRIYTMVDEYDHALNIIEHLQEIPSAYSPYFFHNDPNFDAIRDHPRFLEILARYKER